MIETVEVRALTSQEVKLGRKIQEVSEIIHRALKKGKNITVEDLDEMVEKLKPKVTELHFLDQVMKDLEEYISSHRKMEGRHDRMKRHLPTFKQHSSSMVEAFLKSDWSKVESAAREVTNIIGDVDHHINISERASNYLKSRFTNAPSIFMTAALLDFLGAEQYEKIESLDFSKKLYTAVDFPTSKLHDFYYIVWFMTNLQDTKEPLKIEHSNEFRTFMKVRHANDGGIEELGELMEKYVHSNDKKLVPRILELIDSMPKLKEVNERQKQKIKLVYRGVPGDDHSEDEILKIDRKTKFVATSESRYAARNFAMQKGHLEHADMRRSQVGYIIEYSVTPEAILFDTKLIHTAYGESEILIDASKAKVVKVEEI